MQFLRAYVRLFTDPRPGEDVRDVLRSWPADLVLVDCMSLGALRAALRSGVLTVVLVHLFHRYLTAGWARSPIGAVAAVRGLRPGRLFAAADRVLVASDRELDPAGSGPLPGNVVYSGVVQGWPDDPALPRTCGAGEPEHDRLPRAGCDPAAAVPLMARPNSTTQSRSHYKDGPSVSP